MAFRTQNKKAHFLSKACLWIGTSSFAGIATGTTVLSLVFAERVVGPTVRAIFGTPFGFQEHFFSPMAYRQALLTQSGCTSIAFFTLGIVLARKFPSFSQAVWAANPITVGVGFIVSGNGPFTGQENRLILRVESEQEKSRSSREG